MNIIYTWIRRYTISKHLWEAIDSGNCNITGDLGSMRQWLIIEMLAYYMQIVVLVIVLGTSDDIKKIERSD